MLNSPYVRLSLLSGTILFIFSNKDASVIQQMSFAILPNFFGVALAGVAIFLALGDEKFKNVIRGSDPGGAPSPMMELIASLVHFSLVQILALLNAILGRASEFHWNCYTLASYWLFIYAVLAGIATLFTVFNAAKCFDNMPKDKE